MSEVSRPSLSFDKRRGRLFNAWVEVRFVLSKEHVRHVEVLVSYVSFSRPKSRTLKALQMILAKPLSDSDSASPVEKNHLPGVVLPNFDSNKSCDAPVEVSNDGANVNSSESEAAETEVKEPIHRLADKHASAVEEEQHWTDVLQMFYDDPWFQQRLSDSSRFTVHRCHMPSHNSDDVKQEALVQFAHSIERDRTLGFRPDRGSYGAFLATVIYRCCQKGLRQFRHSGGPSLQSGFQHPLDDQWDVFDEHLDLRESIAHLSEPYRTTIKQICEGHSVEEIARRRKKSVRTIYRWLDKGIVHLRALLPTE